MDRISPLSDDLILQILSFSPAKVAVTTSLLSKRWYNLWKHVPMLTYRDPSINTEHWRASRFVDKFLLLHKAPVLETLNLALGRNCPRTDIETWITIAIARGLRNLNFFQYVPCSVPTRLPGSFYTCQTLVTLRLKALIIVDVPLTICFRSLKVLGLQLVNFSSDETVHRLLSGCPVLTELKVIRSCYENVKIFTIAVPSLQRLTVMDVKLLSLKYGLPGPGDDVGFVIKAPSLKFLKISNQFNWFCSLVKMPDLEKANIKLLHGDSKKLLGCLTSAKHISLCVKPPLSYPICVFYQLVSLKLCTCSSDWCRVILRHTPKLRVLRFELQVSRVPNEVCCSTYIDVQTQWEQPSSVPRCLILSLETVEWIDYKGTQAEKKVVMYLLENSGQLNTMTIRSLKSTKLIERHKMLQELSSTHRSSSKCRLSFI